jgi:serine acetyltransferase
VAAEQPAAASSEEELELTDLDLPFLELVWSDYLAERAGRPEPAWLTALLYAPRLLFNPSLQFALLVRMAQKWPRLLQHPLRWLQVVLFSSEIYWFNGPEAIRLGPGVTFPHPYGITIGPGIRIGAGVAIYNFTNMGYDRHWVEGAPLERVPRIGDRAVIYAYSTVQGNWTVGHDAVVGLHVFLDEDVPPGGLKTRTGLRRCGEWPGEQRPRWVPRGSRR